jgi:hypothetical protein
VATHGGHGLLDLGAFDGGQASRSPLMRAMSRRMRAISSSDGVASAGPVVDGGAEPFPSAQQVVEAGVRVG